MTKNPLNGTALKLIASGALVVAGFFIAGWIERVNGYEDAITGLKETVAAQGAVLDRIAKQVDDIHRFFKPVEKGD